MSLPPDHPLSARRRAPVFRPSFSLALLYLVIFFFVYAFLMIMPDLIRVLGEHPPGPEQAEIAKTQVQALMAGPRLLIPLALSIGTLALGAKLEVLPGLRAPKA